MSADIQTTRSHLQPVLADLARVVENIREDQLDQPTPCTEYSVRELLGHTIGWLEAFAAGFASEDGTSPTQDAGTPDIPLAEAPERIRRAAETLDAAIADGKAERRLVISAPEGMPGDDLLQMMLGEYIAHGWDLARATGQDWAPDEAATRDAHAFMEGMVLPEYRTGEWVMFAQEVPVPEDASALDRYLGFAGRDPQWSAS